MRATITCEPQLPLPLPFPLPLPTLPTPLLLPLLLPALPLPLVLPLLLPLLAFPLPLPLAEPVFWFPFTLPLPVPWLLLPLALPARHSHAGCHRSSPQVTDHLIQRPTKTSGLHYLGATTILCLSNKQKTKIPFLHTAKQLYAQHCLACHNSLAMAERVGPCLLLHQLEWHN